MQKMRLIHLSEIKPEGSFSSNINFRSLFRHKNNLCVLPSFELSVESKKGRNPTVLKPLFEQVTLLGKIPGKQWEILLQVDGRSILFSFNSPRAIFGIYKNI